MSNLASRLAQDYPQFQFRPDTQAHWSAREHIIYYTNDDLQTLHELGHALSGHDHYVQDIELLSIERQAWQVAAQVAPRYGLCVDDEVVETALDSYRDWLHARSKCPSCGQTGWQSRTDLAYQCPACGSRWTASDGKVKQLRRRRQKSR